MYSVFAFNEETKDWDFYGASKSIESLTWLLTELGYDDFWIMGW